MIAINITHTVRLATEKGYHCDGTSSKLFATLGEAKAWCAEEYKGHTRQKMYKDTSFGALHCGYIYGWREIPDWGTTAYYQDWVEFTALVDLSPRRRKETPCE